MTNGTSVDGETVRITATSSGRGLTESKSLRERQAVWSLTADRWSARCSPSATARRPHGGAPPGLGEPADLTRSLSPTLGRPRGRSPRPVPVTSQRGSTLGVLMAHQRTVPAGPFHGSGSRLRASTSASRAATSVRRSLRPRARRRLQRSPTSPTTRAGVLTGCHSSEASLAGAPFNRHSLE